MLTGRAGIETLHIALNGDASAVDRAKAVERIAAEYGPGFAAAIGELAEFGALMAHNEREALRIARNARRRKRGGHHENLSDLGARAADG